MGGASTARTFHADFALALTFEATHHLDPHERTIVRELIEAILLKHDAKRWTNAS